MNDITKIKNPSPFLQAVLKLDNYFSELIRLGDKIEEMDLKSDFDFDQVEKLIKHFAECGEGVSTEVVAMSGELTKLREQAESAAKIVAAKAETVQARKNEQAQKMEEFRVLGEKVRELTVSLQEFKFEEGKVLTEDERAALAMRLEGFESKLQPLIEEAQNLKKQGQTSKIKILEQSADSLGQSLQAVRQKIHSVRDTTPTIN